MPAIGRVGHDADAGNPGRLTVKPWMGPAALFLVLIVAFALLYGIRPGHSLPFKNVASIEGWARCVDGPGDVCPLVGHPLGVELTLGTTTVVAADVASQVGLGTEAALNLLAFISLAAGALGLWILTYLLVARHAAGALAAALFFTSPLVGSHSGMASLYFGFAMLPLPLALAALALRARDRRPKAAVGLIALVFITALVLVYLNPYPWVIATALVSPLGVVVGGMALVKRRWRCACLAGAVVVAVVLPGLIYDARRGPAELTADEPLDFYRSLSVDLAPMVLPTDNVLIGDVLWSPVDGWDKFDFYGDGSQLRGVYLGLPTLAVAAAGAVVLLRRRRQPYLVVGLALGGLACLTLGLGPSLKVADYDSRPVSVDGRYPDYLMPEEEAKFAFPWAPVYERQPFASMRATYRWHAGLRVIVVVLAAGAVGQLAGRRRLVALALAGVLVLDTVPDSLWSLDHRARVHHRELVAFQSDMEQAFGGGRLRAGERALFLPARNDFLIRYIAPTFDVAAYNIAFDKEIARIRKQQPKAITRSITKYNDGSLDGDAVCSLFATGLIDVLVFTDFDMMRDQYRWPPPPAAPAARRDAHVALGIFDDTRFDVDAGHLAVILRPESSACRPP